jgi:hypothetical protein
VDLSPASFTDKNDKKAFNRLKIQMRRMITHPITQYKERVHNALNWNPQWGDKAGYRRGPREFVQPGTQTDRYGTTAGRATLTQLENRARDGFVGQGPYYMNYPAAAAAYEMPYEINQVRGQGDFFSDLGDAFTNPRTWQQAAQVLTPVATLAAGAVGGPAAAALTQSALGAANHYVATGQAPDLNTAMRMVGSGSQLIRGSGSYQLPALDAYQSGFGTASGVGNNFSPYSMAQQQGNWHGTDGIASLKDQLSDLQNEIRRGNRKKSSRQVDYDDENDEGDNEEDEDEDASFTKKRRRVQFGGTVPASLKESAAMPVAGTPVIVQTGRDNGGTVQTNQIVDPGKRYSRTAPNWYSPNDDTGDMIVEHREYLGDVTPTTADFATLLTLNINAGLFDTVPLLSRFAQYFEEYKFDKFVIYFRSLVTPGNNQAAGAVMLSTVYNPMSNTFATKRAMENSEFTASGKVTDEIIMGVECDPKKNTGNGRLYTRYGALPTGSNLQDYDMGFIQVCTQGATPHVDIGEIWLEYKCRLSKLRDVSQQPLAISEGWALAVGKSYVVSPFVAAYECLGGTIGSIEGLQQSPMFPVTYDQQQPAQNWQQNTDLSWTYGSVDGSAPAGTQGNIVQCYACSPSVVLNSISDNQAGGTITQFGFQFATVAGGVYCYQFAMALSMFPTYTPVPGWGTVQVSVVQGNAKVSNAGQLNLAPRGNTPSGGSIAPRIVQGEVTIQQLGSSGGVVLLMITVNGTSFDNTVANIMCNSVQHSFVRVA